MAGPTKHTAPDPDVGALAVSTRVGYGLGSVATGAFGAVPGLLLLPYLTDRIGIGAGLAGLMVFLPKAWDVVLNPIAGRISDRFDHPQGRRRPFLIRAGLLLAVLFVAMFAGPTSPQLVAGVWVVLAFLACASAYAFFQVPYVAMPAELTDSYDERTKLMTWRVAILALAILLSGGLSPILRDQFGYRAVGLFVGVLIAIGAVAAWRGTANAPTKSPTSAGGSLQDQLRIVRTSAPFRWLFATFVVQALATGIMLAGVDYVARSVLRDKGFSSVLFVCFVGPALMVTPLWQKFAERHDKRAGYIVSSVLLGGGALAAFAGMHLGAVTAALAVAVVGVGYAGAQLFPMAMLPDVAADDAERSGENRVGVFTGVWTAGETLGLALGPFVYAAVLAIGGYVSSTDGLARQPDSAVTAIGLGFSVLPAALIAGSLVLLVRYRLAPRRA